MRKCSNGRLFQKLKYLKFENGAKLSNVLGENVQLEEVCGVSRVKSSEECASPTLGHDDDDDDFFISSEFENAYALHKNAYVSNF
jgi:hypothetical protein